MTKTQLVNFKTPDGLLLPGLLYKPKNKTDKAALFLHGNGSASVFYKVEEMNLFGEKLTRKNIAFFPFNNRGAHYIKRLTKFENGDKKKILLGTTYELIRDSIKDIDGALRFLENKGFRQFYLIGHSTGANKICLYNFYQPKNPVKKYVLIAGGDDSGIYYRLWGKKKFFSALTKAKQAINQGKGEKLAPKYLVNYPLSYQSLYDTINPDGDYNVFPFNQYINNLKLSKKKLFRHYRSINKPTLVIYGENDQYAYGQTETIVNILKKQTRQKNLFRFKIIKGADHSFSDHKKQLVQTVVDWL